MHLSLSLSICMYVYKISFDRTRSTLTPSHTLMHVQGNTTIYSPPTRESIATSRMMFWARVLSVAGKNLALMLPCKYFGVFLLAFYMALALHKFS